jgi:hypothetical protein
MINFIKKLFGGKPAEPVVEVPYKVETVVETPAPAPVAENTPQAVVKSTAPAKKPVAKKTGGRPKGPRKPKTPKVQK